MCSLSYWVKLYGSVSFFYLKNTYRVHIKEYKVVYLHILARLFNSNVLYTYKFIKLLPFRPTACILIYSIDRARLGLL